MLRVSTPKPVGGVGERGVWIPSVIIGTLWSDNGDVHENVADK